MRKDRGAALLLVLLLVALLAVIVLEFQRRARVDLHAAENLRDDLQAHALLRSGSGVAEQLLVIYSKNSVGDMKSYATTEKGGELFWNFLFAGEPLEVPPPSAAIDAAAGLRARLRDLYGCFPLGALVGDAVEPRRTMFKYFLGHVKEYLGSHDDPRLEKLDPEGLAEAIIEKLAGAPTDQPPIASLDELAGVEGFTPEILRAFRPFLDVRKEWKFNANARCVPLIMTMQTKTVDEAVDIRQVLMDDPIPKDSAIPNAAELGGLSPEFAGSLAIKSSRVEILFEAEVNGGIRRARAVYQLPPQTTASAKFYLARWEEGWVDEEIGAPERKPQTTKGKAP